MEELIKQMLAIVGEMKKLNIRATAVSILVVGQLDVLKEMASPAQLDALGAMEAKYMAAVLPLLESQEEQDD